MSILMDPDTRTYARHLMLFTFWLLFFIKYIFFLALSDCLYFFILYSSVEHVGALDRDPHGL
jgi:hypothetical protein